MVIHEVEEGVRLEYHVHRLVRIIIVFPHLFVHMQTVLRDGALLKLDLVLQLEISFCRDPLQTWLHVDQPADDAALRIRDLDRMVGCEKQKAVRRKVEAALPLDVHYHRLMTDQGVELGVVGNMAEISVELDCHEWISSKLFHRERISKPRKLSRVEADRITSKQFFNDTKNCSLSCSGISVEHKKLLNASRVSRDNSTDRPLNLLTLLRQI